MATQIKDLTVEELQVIIAGTVKQTIEDMLEDIQAFSNQKYINSVAEARAEYKAGNIKNFEDVFGV